MADQVSPVPGSAHTSSSPALGLGARASGRPDTERRTRRTDGLAELVANLAWIGYVPILLCVLKRDSRYWSRCGFAVCVMSDVSREAASGTEPLPLAPAGKGHRVPLLTQASVRDGLAGGGVARFARCDRVASAALLQFMIAAAASCGVLLGAASV